VAVLQNGSLPDARDVAGTVDTIVEKVNDHALGSPAVIVLGKCVGLLTTELVMERDHQTKP
jgi:siroheme synthase